MASELRHKVFQQKINSLAKGCVASSIFFAVARTNLENILTGSSLKNRERKFRFDINTLPCVKLIASGNLLYSTGSSAWCSVMTQMGGMGVRVEGRSKREGIYVYIWLIHFTVQQKLTQHCKAIILQFIKKNNVHISDRDVCEGLYPTERCVQSLNMEGSWSLLCLCMYVNIVMLVMIPDGSPPRSHPQCTFHSITFSGKPRNTPLKEDYERSSIQLLPVSHRFSQQYSNIY